MSDGPHPKNRVEAIRWARQVMADPTAVFLDTETTGLGAASEVVDLAVVALNGEVLINHLVRPANRIPTDATFIHGISNRDVANAPDWTGIVRMFRPVLENRTIVAYNAQFDRSMVDQNCVLAEMPILDARWTCAMRAFTAFRRDCPEPPRMHGWHRLSTAARSFGIAEPQHRALSDALACRLVVARMAESEPLF
ncbi:MAG: 3'-5' exonuclease [Thermomicrobiales bacterium]